MSATTAMKHLHQNQLVYASKWTGSKKSSYKCKEQTNSILTKYEETFFSFIAGVVDDNPLFLILYTPYKRNVEILRTPYLLTLWPSKTKHGRGQVSSVQCACTWSVWQELFIPPPPLVVYFSTSTQWCFCRGFLYSLNWNSSPIPGSGVSTREIV